MGIRLGDIAPDFEAETTKGPIKFHEWIGNSWVSACSAHRAWTTDIHPLLNHRPSSSRTRVTSLPSAPLSSLKSRGGDYLTIVQTTMGFKHPMIYRAPDFEKRGVKLIGISANGLVDHEKWIKDINDWGSQFGPTDVQYPIVSLTFMRYTGKYVWFQMYAVGQS